MRYRFSSLSPLQKIRIPGYKEAGLWRGIPAVYTLHAGDISAGAQKTDHREWRCMNGNDCLPCGAAPGFTGAPGVGDMPSAKMKDGHLNLVGLRIPKVRPWIPFGDACVMSVFVISCASAHHHTACYGGGAIPAIPVQSSCQYAIKKCAWRDHIIKIACDKRTACDQFIYNAHNLHYYSYRGIGDRRVFISGYHRPLRNIKIQRLQAARIPSGVIKYLP